MVKHFINRPVFASVVSILIVILGILGLRALPVTQYPDIAPPTVSISANYTGASFSTCSRVVCGDTYRGWRNIGILGNRKCTQPQNS